MATGLQTKRNVLLSIAEWSAQRLVAAEVSFFRRSLAFLRDPSSLNQARAYDARLAARRFARSLSEDLQALGRVGLEGAGKSITEALAAKIAAERERHFAHHCSLAGTWLPLQPSDVPASDPS